MRKQAHVRGSEASADTAELAARRLDEAIADGSEALIVARAVEFKKASPAGFQAFLEEQDEYYLQQRDEYGLDPDDFDESEMPSYVLGGDVARVIEQEQSQVFSAQLANKIAGLEKASHTVYDGRLREKGKLPSPGDEQAQQYHAAVADYIFETSGIHLAQLVNDGKGDEAAEHWLRADAQLGAMDKEARLGVFKKSILEVEDGSVAAGLKTGGDANAEQLAEITNLLRAQNGLGPADAPELRGYDPEWQPELSQEKAADPPQTVGEFKAELLEGTGEESTSVQADDAWTVGEPGAEQRTTFVQVTRDRAAEERTEREARENAAGLPRSFS
jgi:hypothetical protein